VHHNQIIIIWHDAGSGCMAYNWSVAFLWERKRLTWWKVQQPHYGIQPHWCDHHRYFLHAYHVDYVMHDFFGSCPHLIRSTSFIASGSRLSFYIFLVCCIGSDWLLDLKCSSSNYHKILTTLLPDFIGGLSIKLSCIRKMGFPWFLLLNALLCALPLFF